ncbi:hypothetical protein RND81_13G114800 [Saponaria officinalis]|uniref:BHLH domain-containing protein n=1 Tax=Saponaria officinalis TaxID=3572 RepID=A0AAW1GYM4_SAPOF
MVWSNFEVTELTWENGQLAMHELGGIFPPPVSTTSSSPKPTWEGDVGGVGDTLESIVHQATCCNKHVPKLMPEPQQQANFGSVVASSGGKWGEKSGQIKTPGPPPPPGMLKKRTRSETEHRGLANDHESACASANAVVSRENNETTMMTWSYESPRSSTRTKTTNDEDSACHGGSENQDEERETKGETGRSYQTRKGRAAAVHNQSERRRRDRINQKMKALQKLVPNSSKTDKASMLDEVIEYLKQLQAQVQMMSHARFMPQMMMPLGIQQHLHQMSLLARMGMGASLGMGMTMPNTSNIGHTPPAAQPIPSMLHPSQVAAAASTFVPPAFMVPQMIGPMQLTSSGLGNSSSAHLQDAYNTLLAQSMNLELCNRIAALQRQQQTPSQPASNQLQPMHHVQRS